MINALDVLNALNDLILSEYPNDKSYINLLPKEFKRPSFLYEHVRQTREDDTRWTQRITDYLTVTIFIPMDTHGHCDQAQLLQRQFAVMDLLSTPALTVGDRAVKITASAGGASPGEAYVDVTAQYAEDRAATKPDAENVQEINMNYDIEKEG